MVECGRADGDDVVVDIVSQTPIQRMQLVLQSLCLRLRQQTGVPRLVKVTSWRSATDGYIRVGFDIQPPLPDGLSADWRRPILQMGVTNEWIDAKIKVD